MRPIVVIGIICACYFVGALVASYVVGRTEESSSDGFWEAAFWPIYLPLAMIDWSFELGARGRKK